MNVRRNNHERDLDAKAEEALAKRMERLNIPKREPKKEKALSLDDDITLRGIGILKNKQSLEKEIAERKIQVQKEREQALLIHELQLFIEKTISTYFRQIILEKEFKYLYPANYFPNTYDAQSYIFWTSLKDFVLDRISNGSAQIILTLDLERVLKLKNTQCVVFQPFWKDAPKKTFKEKLFDKSAQSGNVAGMFIHARMFSRLYPNLLNSIKQKELVNLPTQAEAEFELFILELELIFIKLWVIEHSVSRNIGTKYQHPLRLKGGRLVTYEKQPSIKVGEWHHT